MLKSKKALIFLIPLTLIIWGTIAYKIYNGLNPELPPMEPADRSRFRESGNKKLPLIPFKKPLYDPFLGTKYIEEKTDIPSDKNIITNRKLVKWPQVNYIGFIKDKQGLRKVVALQVDGSVQTFEVGQVIDSIQLIRAKSNYVELKYQGNLKRIEKK